MAAYLYLAARNKPLDYFTVYTYFITCVYKLIVMIWYYTYSIVCCEWNILVRPCTCTVLRYRGLSWRYVRRVRTQHPLSSLAGNLCRLQPSRNVQIDESNWKLAKIISQSSRVITTARISAKLVWSSLKWSIAHSDYLLTFFLLKY